VALAAALGAAAPGAPEAAGPPPEMRLVPAGTYRPFFPVKDEAPIRVPAFHLDALPATHAEFLAFVRESPRWRRSAVPRIFADESYLSDWAGDLELGDGAPPDRPATFVSWFAAAAYCASRGKRLPSEAEWELAAQPTGEDDAARAESERRILAFYARPRAALPRVGGTPPNALGIQDLHGVIWEWVDDFDASFAASDSRADRDRALDAVCGGAATGAADTRSYATFMRVAFRTSLEARYALHHLGFRCARSIE
jgi:formylglycine-generating enzyme required for sulfatase activity